VPGAIQRLALQNQCKGAVDDVVNRVGPRAARHFTARTLETQLKVTLALAVAGAHTFVIADSVTVDARVAIITGAAFALPSEVPKDAGLVASHAGIVWRAPAFLRRSVARAVAGAVAGRGTNAGRGGTINAQPVGLAYTRACGRIANAVPRTVR